MWERSRSREAGIEQSAAEWGVSPLKPKTQMSQSVARTVQTASDFSIYGLHFFILHHCRWEFWFRFGYWISSSNILCWIVSEYTEMRKANISSLAFILFWLVRMLSVRKDNRSRSRSTLIFTAVVELDWWHCRHRNCNCRYFCHLEAMWTWSVICGAYWRRIAITAPILSCFLGSWIDHVIYVMAVKQYTLSMYTVSTEYQCRI